MPGRPKKPLEEWTEKTISWTEAQKRIGPTAKEFFKRKTFKKFYNTNGPSKQDIKNILAEFTTTLDGVPGSTVFTYRGNIVNILKKYYKEKILVPQAPSGIGPNKYMLSVRDNYYYYEQRDDVKKTIDTYLVEFNSWLFSNLITIRNIDSTTQELEININNANHMKYMKKSNYPSKETELDTLMKYILSMFLDICHDAGWGKTKKKQGIIFEGSSLYESFMKYLNETGFVQCLHKGYLESDNLKEYMKTLESEIKESGWEGKLFRRWHGRKEVTVYKTAHMNKEIKPLGGFKTQFSDQTNTSQLLRATANTKLPCGYSTACAGDKGIKFASFDSMRECADPIINAFQHLIIGVPSPEEGKKRSIAPGFMYYLGIVRKPTLQDVKTELRNFMKDYIAWYNKWVNTEGESDPKAKTFIRTITAATKNKLKFYYKYHNGKERKQGERRRSTDDYERCIESLVGNKFRLYTNPNFSYKYTLNRTPLLDIKYSETDDKDVTIEIIRRGEKEETTGPRPPMSAAGTKEQNSFLYTTIKSTGDKGIHAQALLANGFVKTGDNAFGNIICCEQDLFINEDITYSPHKVNVFMKESKTPNLMFEPYVHTGTTTDPDLLYAFFEDANNKFRKSFDPNEAFSPVESKNIHYAMTELTDSNSAKSDAASTELTSKRGRSKSSPGSARAGTSTQSGSASTSAGSDSVKLPKKRERSPGSGSGSAAREQKRSSVPRNRSVTGTFELPYSASQL